MTGGGNQDAGGENGEKPVPRDQEHSHRIGSGQRHANNGLRHRVIEGHIGVGLEAVVVERDAMESEVRGAEHRATDAPAEETRGGLVEAPLTFGLA